MKTYKAYNYIEIKQPIGVFYMCSIPALELLSMVEAKARGLDNDGVQRQRSSKRINEVRMYCADPDAVFPTPIVISVYNDADVMIDDVNRSIIINVDSIIGDVIDGQHRLWGIKEAVNASEFLLPVVFMFNLTIEEKAYVFSTINSNQTKVDPSLIYDLFDVSLHRSPYKTVHEIARVMNYSKESPFYNRLKMLGKKEKTQENATLSQGTFAKSILQLITRTPKEDVILLKNGDRLKDDNRCPLRYFFISDRDDVIIKILLNCFNALKSVFKDEWDNPNTNILWKTTGFCGVIFSLRSILRKGYLESQMTFEFFVHCFTTFQISLMRNGMTLTSQSFPGGGEQNQKKLAKLITESIVELNNEQYSKNLIWVSDIEQFIEWIDDVSNYELVDIVYALKDGKTPYNTMKVKEYDDSIEFVYVNADVAVYVRNEEREKWIRRLEQKYMSGMDVDSWFGYKQQLQEKD